MNEIQKLESFEYELAIAQTVEGAKIVKDKAEAIAKFAKANKAATEAQNKIGRFIIECGSVMGEYLEQEFPQGGNRGNQYTRANLEEVEVAKMPVDYNESSNTRLIYKQPELTDEVMEEIEERGEVITLNKVQKEIRKKLKNEIIIEPTFDENIKTECQCPNCGYEW